MITRMTPKRMTRMLRDLSDSTTLLLPQRFHIRACGCRSFHTRIGGHETWAYDYCLRELKMEKAAAQLAMILYTFRGEVMYGTS